MDQYIQSSADAGTSISDTGTYTIFQLKEGEALRYHRFTSLDRLHHAGHQVEFKNYDAVYSAELPASQSVGQLLESLYTKFNIDHPSDFTGHSMSVSDIVVLETEGKRAVYYVDSIGFAEVPEFLADLPAKEKPSLADKVQAAQARKSAQTSAKEQGTFEPEH